MLVTSSRLGRTLLQLKRKALAASGVAALVAVVFAAFLGPTSRLGAVILALSASVLASLVVAAIALERNEFADGVYSLGIEQIFKNRQQDLPEELWTSLCRTVRRHFRVLGMANHGYLNSESAQQQTRDAISTALGRKKVTVEVLWLDPTHELAELREQEENSRGLRRDTCDSIAFFWKLRDELGSDKACRLSLREYTSLPTCGITWADDYLVVTHYLSGELNLTAPGLVLQANPGLGRRLLARISKQEASAPGLSSAYMKNYTEISGDRWSRPVDAERVAELLRFRDDKLGDQAGKKSEAELRRAFRSDTSSPGH